MKLYHGSTVPVMAPNVNFAQVGRDFGAAFYTTDIYEQAERWALRKALIASKQKGDNTTAIVSEYDFDEIGAENALKILRFVNPDYERLNLMVNCRTNPAYVHGYDIVIGKVANDAVGETVNYVAQGIMRKEDALERLRFQKINNQIAFCTEKALKYIAYVRRIEVATK